MDETKKPPPQSALSRSKARYRRAGRTLPPVAITEQQAAKLAQILAVAGTTYSAWVRNMIDRA